MGVYASVSDVASEFKTITFGAATPVKDTEVDAFIEQFEAYADARLSGTYTVPITGTNSLKIMKMITVWCVADRVREIMQVKNIGAPEVQQGTRPMNSCYEAKKILEQIRMKDVILTDAVALSDSGFDSFTSKNGLENFYKKDVDQW